MIGRLRQAFATISTAPWRRAPFLLLRQPGLLAATAGAVAVMVAAASSVPLFLSSVATASTAIQAEARCAPDTGATLADLDRAAEVVDPGPDPFAALRPDLAPANRWARLVGEVPLSVAGGRDSVDVRVLARDDAGEHVEVVDGALVDGVWVTDTLADDLGLGVGDPVTIGDARVPVVAVYRDLAGLTVDDFWCANADMLLYEERGADLVPPPPLVIADRATLADLIPPTARSAIGVWQAPLGDDLRLGDAGDLAHTLACRGRRAGALAWCADGQPLIPSGRFDTARPARDDRDFLDRYLSSSLPYVIERTRAIRTSVASGVWPVAAFATVAGLGLVVAAASLWFDRRRREVTLLGVRGASPAAVGVKAALEVLPAIVTGAALGAGAAYGAVVWLGPSPALEPAAVEQALGAAAACWSVATLAVAASVAWRTRRPEQVTRRHPLALVPWELAMVAAAVVSHRRLDEVGVPVDEGASVSEVDALGLLFPVVALVAALAVLVRLLVVAIGPVRRLTSRAPLPLGLAVRRVARGRVAAAGLVAAASVAAGVLGYSTTMERSMHETLEAKAATFVGADTAVRIHDGAELPEDVAPRSTPIVFHGQSWIDTGDGRESAGVLVVDPATFADVAFWDDTFATESLPRILDRLADDGEVAAVVLGADPASTAEVGVTQQGTVRFDVVPIAGVDAFPGQRRAEVTVVISAPAASRLGLDGGRHERWIDGDHDATIAALGRDGLAFDELRQASDVADDAAFRTVSWTFGYLQALGLVAGLLVVGAVAVHLDARHRERLLAHLFLRRMGLRERAHGGALALELAASVVVGAWAGLVVAVGVAWLAHDLMDPVPTFSPTPLLRPAVGVIAIAALAAVAVAAVGALVAQRRLERGDVVEVLRGGT